MHSLTDFEDEERFFASYEAEQATAASPELDSEAGQPPTPEELAHLARFRRPVLVVVASMALLSIVALGMHGSLQRGSQRQLVAHYHSALTAPTSAGAVTGALERHTSVRESSSAFVPEALSAFLAETLSALWPEAFSTASAAAPTFGVSATALQPEPVTPDTAPTQISAQPAVNPLGAFMAASTQMCLRPVGSSYGPRQ
jgi:hypothetical protein